SRSRRTFPPTARRPSPFRHRENLVLNRSDVVVPDGISPLIGYREWDVLDELGSPRLLSLFRPTEWPYERPLRAQCLRHDRWE
ncbi:MAG: hypothetical protein ACXVQU_03750, partial [Actinomycetota bacterium]